MRLIVILILFSLILPEAYAFNEYSYNTNGERVYTEITPEITHYNKSRPRRAFIRQPRKNWEMTPAMRARKRTSSQFTHRN